MEAIICVQKLCCLPCGWIGWCKNIDHECERRFRGIFRSSVMQSLVEQKYLRPYSDTYGWRLTPVGYTWLAEQGFPMQADRHTQRVNRRFANAEVILTMYAAGIDPFAALRFLRCESMTVIFLHLYCGQRMDSIRWAAI